MRIHHSTFRVDVDPLSKVAWPVLYADFLLVEFRHLEKQIINMITTPNLFVEYLSSSASNIVIQQMRCFLRMYHMHAVVLNTFGDKKFGSLSP
jgi:hypothetical protein